MCECYSPFLQYKNCSQIGRGSFAPPAASRQTKDMSTFFKLLIFICLQNGVTARVMNAENLKAAPEQLPTVTIDTCKTCTEMFELLKDLMSDPGVQGMVKHDLGLMCEALRKSFGPASEKICKDMVDKNLPLAFSIFDSVLPVWALLQKPGVLCSALGLCVVEVENELQGLMAKLQTALKSPALGVKSDLQCKFCVYLIELLEGLLPKEKTEEAIAHMLDQVCHLVPAAYRDQCVAFIELYSKKLIELLLNKSSPHTICTLIHLCKGMETAITGAHMSGYACAMSSYRCQNLLTAMECGAVEYCQKYAWL
ncbi:surfactant protein Ba isoform X1 [Alosa pseudoharengus]|uniref:surfactant protein Ba isoform X1 n=2 Tax=Alosa pseudoharengus TaxID=34774 RepID=UPI003F8A99F5